MKKITNTEEANIYYKKVNNLVDDYIKKWKVLPSEIKRFFDKNLKSFLERNGLSDIGGIETVVRDVVNHRYHMELDKVLKFENFQINENSLNIGNVTINHEKILADFYNTSLGHVECLDDKIHLYNVNDFGKKINVIIFSEEELNKIYSNIENSILSNFKGKSVSIKEIDNIQINTPIKLKFDNIIDMENFKSELKNKINKNNLILIIGNILKKSKDNFNIKYLGEKNNHFIWELVNN